MLAKIVVAGLNNFIERLSPQSLSMTIVFSKCDRYPEHLFDIVLIQKPKGVGEVYSVMPKNNQFFYS